MKSRTEEAVFGDRDPGGGRQRRGDALVTSQSMPALAGAAASASAVFASGLRGGATAARQAEKRATNKKQNLKKTKHKKTMVTASTAESLGMSNVNKGKRSIYTRATQFLSNEAASRSQALDMEMLENVDAISLTKRRLQGAITQSRIILLGSLDSFFRRAVARFRHSTLAGAIDVWRMYAAKVSLSGSFWISLDFAFSLSSPSFSLSPPHADRPDQTRSNGNPKTRPRLCRAQGSRGAPAARAQDRGHHREGGEKGRRSAAGAGLVAGPLPRDEDHAEGTTGVLSEAARVDVAHPGLVEGRAGSRARRGESCRVVSPLASCLSSLLLSLLSSPLLSSPLLS